MRLNRGPYFAVNVRTADLAGLRITPKKGPEAESGPIKPR